MNLKKPSTTPDNKVSSQEELESAQALLAHVASQNQYGRGNYQHNARTATSSDPTGRHPPVKPILRRCGNEGPVKGGAQVRPGRS